MKPAERAFDTDSLEGSLWKYDPARRWHWGLLIVGIVAATAVISLFIDMQTLTRTKTAKQFAIPVRQDSSARTRPATPLIDPEVSTLGTRSSISPMPLRLLLTGTVVGVDARDSRAFIGVDDRNSQTYSVGATLVNGAHLEAVFHDHVVLRGPDNAVTLYIRDRGGRPSSGDADRLLWVTRDSSPRTVAVPSSRDVFSEYVRYGPAYDGPELRGYQVYAGGTGGVFYQLGLRPGDLVTALNGIPLSEPTQAVGMFEQLASGLEMTASLVRDGKRLEATLDGGLIVSAEQIRELIGSADPGTN